MLINTDLQRRAVVATDGMPWVDSPMAGVGRRMLERDGEDGARRATSVVRYAPGSRFSPHTHRAGEEFLVLEGTFSDESGDYPAGTYVRNPPGSRHAPHSAPGTTIFVKLQQFAADDAAQVVIDTTAGQWEAGQGAGVDVMALHSHGSERVSLERWAPGTRIDRHLHPGGEEIFVVEGSFEDEDGTYAKATWVRNPPGSAHAPSSREGCVVYVKQGHLG